MKRFNALCLALLSLSFAGLSYAESKDQMAVDKVLNQLHQYASEAKGEAYFGLYHDDAVFIGTDVNERWTLAQFKSYSMPIFNQGRGWTYHKRNRHIFISDDRNTAWFDEVLDSESYGTSRGSGVLVKTDAGWKFSQYHLTFPLPNDLAKDFTQKIKDYEKPAKTAE